MKLSVLCSDPAHPIQPRLRDWCGRQSVHHQVELVTHSAALSGGDLLFLISCAEVIGSEIRGRYGASLVIHASDLPHGRGWSPLVWQVLEGRNRIAVTLLEAADQVDRGPIWHQVWLDLEGHELVDELHAALFDAELDLMDYAVAQARQIRPRPQAEAVGKPYRRRTPEDSRIDPDRNLAEQFDLLRVADPDRYPAFFDFRGHRYQIILKKVMPDE